MWIALRKSAVLGSASESAALSLDSASHCPPTGPSLFRKGKPTPWPLLLRASTRVPWTSALLNRISANSMPDPSGERWRWLRLDFPVSLTPLLGSASEQQTSDGSGRTSRGSSESVEPLACSSKTSQGSSGTPVAILTEGIWMSPQMTLLGDSEKFSGLWPNSGSMRNGVVSERPQWALRTSATEFSSWPTATATDGGANSQRESRDCGGADLKEAAQNWRTPCERDHHPSTLGNRTRNPDQILLAHQTAFWEALPQVQPTRSGMTCWCGASGCVQPSHVRKLNPLFVEWLMGWPLYWLTTEPTAFGRPATDAFLSRQRRLLWSLCGGQ